MKAIEYEYKKTQKYTEKYLDYIAPEFESEQHQAKASRKTACFLLYSVV